MKFGKKLRSRRGITMTELLVAIAVLGIMSAAVVTGIGAAGRVRRDSTEVSQTQTLLSTLSQAISDELRFARDIVSDTAGVRYTSATFGANAVMAVDGEGRVYVQSGIAAPMALIGSGAYGAYTTDLEITYVAADCCFQVKLMIYGGSTLRCEQTYLVRALNPPA